MNFLKKLGCSVAIASVLSTSIISSSVSNHYYSSSFPIITMIEAKAESDTIRLYNQNEPKWDNQYHLQANGCGIFSFCNAIYAVNGIKPDPNEVVKWAIGKGAYDDELNRFPFYDNIEKAFGHKYKFKVMFYKWGKITDKQLINSLQQKNRVVVAHVKKHFIAIINYREINKKKEYLVVESYEWHTRNLSSVGWYTADKLSQGDTNVDWFVVLQSSIDNNTGIEQGAVRQIKSKYFPKYTGNSKSITTALNAVGANSYFDNRKKIAKVNDIKHYVDKEYQNNVMLSLLKKGKLKNPDAS